MQIDFDAMSAELNLKKAAASMRWTRLKKAIEEGKPPGPAAHQFLWLAVKNSTRVKVCLFLVFSKLGSIVFIATQNLAMNPDSAFTLLRELYGSYPKTANRIADLMSSLLTGKSSLMLAISNLVPRPCASLA